MNKKVISELIKKNEIQVIEKSLVSLFLEEKEIETKNSFLKNYLSSIDSTQKENIDKIIQKYRVKLSLESLERSFELLFETNDKKLSGIFYTPTYIAEYILNEILTESSNVKILDPSCGAGIFNYITLKAIKKKFPMKSAIEIIENNIYACDIDSVSTTRTKVMLIVTALIYGEDARKINLNVKTIDSLNKDFKWEKEFPDVFNQKKGFDGVVGNPPYIRIQNLDKNNKQYIQDNWYSANRGNIDIYFPFIELGLSLLNKKGKLGYITPNSYFNTSAGKNLRKLLKNNRSIHKIVNFDYIKVFQDVNVYSCISILTKTPNPYILYHKVNAELKHLNLTEDVFKKVYFESLNNEKGWDLLSAEELEKISFIENVGSKLIDIAEINCGLATLADSIYLLDSKYQKSVEGKIYDIEPEICRPIIKASRTHSDEDIKNNNMKIIWVYDENGKIIPEKEFNDKYPIAYSYLKAMKEKLSLRDKGKKNPIAWYAFGRTQGLTSTFGEKLLTSNMNKKPNFVHCKETDSTFFAGYQVKPKNMSLNLLKKILNSKIMEDYIYLKSKSYQGGWKSYAKSFIKDFSIPELNNEEMIFLENEENPDKINNFLEKKYYKNNKSHQSKLI